MTIQCQAIHRGGRCPADAVTCLTLACEHEHMDSNLICASCLVMVRVQIGIGEFFCTPCDESLSPHECLISEVAERRMTEAGLDAYLRD